MLPACLRGVSDVPTRRRCRCPGSTAVAPPVALGPACQGPGQGAHTPRSSDHRRRRKPAYPMGQDRPKGSLWPLPPALMRRTLGEAGERSLQLHDLVLFLFCFEKFLVVYLRETGREMLPECLSFSRRSFP